MKSSEIDEYIEFYEDGMGTPFFKGFYAFEYLLGQNRIRKGSVIRVRKYSQPIDDHYEVTEDGKLEFYPAPGQADRPGVFEPGEILSEENAPDGWEADRIFPKPHQRTS